MDVDPRITQARRDLTFHPKVRFYGVISSLLKPVVEYTIETGATDGRHLFYNPNWLDTLNKLQIFMFVWHEVAHVAHKHHLRIGDRDLKLANIAADYQINGSAVEAGLMLWDGAYYDPQYVGLSFETIYRMLLDESAKTPDWKPQRKGDKEPAPGEFDPGQLGQFTRPSTLDPNELRLSEVKLDMVMNQAIAVINRAAGKLPSFIYEFVKETFESRTDWETQLRDFLTPWQRNSLSWTTPNRRYPLADFILPGRVPDDINHIAFLIDGSGSISQSIFTAFKSEAQAVLDTGLIDKATFVFFDSRVYHTATYERGDVIKSAPFTKGGTLYQPAFEWLSDNASDISGAVVFTDLLPGDWHVVEQPLFPVLWAVSGDPRLYRELMKIVPFGECVELELN